MSQVSYIKSNGVPVEFYYSLLIILASNLMVPCPQAHYEGI